LTGKDITEEIKQFLFAHVESVEQLEIMFLLRQDPEKWWSARSIADELRASASSVSNRLNFIDKLKLLEKDNNNMVRYNPQDPEIQRVVDELSEVYKVRKHRVFEIIFSPLKRARNFADAFVISGKRNGDKDG